MDTLSELDVRDELTKHAQWCQLGERKCIDCRAARDPRTINAIVIANTERNRLGSWIDQHEWLCVYCGGYAEHDDHLVPEPWTGRTARKFVPVVPSCSDCNLRINDALLFTIAARAEVVANSLRRKYVKQLPIPDRPPEWFDDFGERMRLNLRAAQARRVELRRRLMVLDAGGADCVVEDLWVTR